MAEEMVTPIGNPIDVSDVTYMRKESSLKWERKFPLHAY